MDSLDEIVRLLQSYEGITRKFVLPRIISKLRELSYQGDQPHSLGEDSAAIRTESDEVILLTTDSIIEDLCLNHPRAAGFNVVLASVMDIYAAGGVPTSFAVALSYSDPEIGERLLDGLIEGSNRFRVPIVRGHTNPSASSTYVVGSATGTVKKDDLLTAGGAMTGDKLVLVFDREGQRGSSYKLGWDSVTDRTEEEVVMRLSIMDRLARSHLLNAAKDVSVAGMIGTAGMLVEYSGKGGTVDLDAVRESSPSEISLVDWLRMFISLGFLLAVPEAQGGARHVRLLQRPGPDPSGQ
ncbi:MAG: AIR synthase related protein [Candidatus Thorarchaeota archaeon]|jgi:selenophosphate synthetase-related protein